MTARKDDAVAANRAAWNQTAPYHKANEQYAKLLKAFSRKGHSRFDEVATKHLKTIGVAGRNVAQVCCNNGREILSVKNMGAARCVGFDFSAEFLAQARELCAVAGQECEFVETDVYKIPKEFDGAFDVVLTTVGVYGWMPDLPGLFAAIARLLKPGGHYFAYEQHPILDLLEAQDRQDPSQTPASYFRQGPDVDAVSLDYYGGADYAAETSYWYTHKISDVVTACIRTGLTLTHLAEYPHNISSPEFDVHEEQAMQFPLSFSLVARKGAD